TIDALMSLLSIAYVLVGGGVAPPDNFCPELDAVMEKAMACTRDGLDEAKP
ncbi:hypothetical protein H4R21_003281, partial [Coemansia helicoidea]